jgi:hypothetical protein
MESIVSKIDEMVVDFKSNNKYNPSTLYIGDTHLERLLQEIGESLLLVREPSKNCTYKEMIVMRHANKEVCYVQ